MIVVRIKNQVHKDADYSHLRGIQFEILDLMDGETYLLKNGKPFLVQAKDVTLESGTIPPISEIKHRWGTMTLEEKENLIGLTK